ncbi:MAG: hypothetical protein ACRDPY_30505 [Streptosporangiaceae bacterium]
MRARSDVARSLAAAWAASAAITATDGPARGQPLQPVAEETGADPVVDRAVAHGDEHVIKFSDAAETYARTGDPRALAAPPN